jgi:hypothetical protein
LQFLSIFMQSSSLQLCNTHCKNSNTVHQKLGTGQANYFC